jgi:hypothetical protein
VQRDHNGAASRSPALRNALPLVAHGRFSTSTDASRSSVPDARIEKFSCNQVHSGSFVVGINIRCWNKLSSAGISLSATCREITSLPSTLLSSTTRNRNKKISDGETSVTKRILHTNSNYTFIECRDSLEHEVECSQAYQPSPTRHHKPTQPKYSATVLQ